MKEKDRYITILLCGSEGYTARLQQRIKDSAPGVLIHTTKLEVWGTFKREALRNEGERRVH